MALEPGTHLGRYIILSALGAGGMGEVYRARDTRLDRDVAIKVLPQHLARDSHALARFEAEAKAVAALEHPNILVLHDVSNENDVSFVVTELLEGETLAQRLSRSALPWRKAVEVGVGVAEGLGAAHARGIVHRDLKPANVFLTAAGQIKILDFGLARRTAPDAAQAETVPFGPPLTEPTVVYGTAPYVSPEQVNGLPADARSDIFSLGCVLYEMLTGRCAFARKTRSETLSAIAHEEPLVLSESGKSLPPELELVVRHCLEKCPEERFQSARDVAFALRGLLSGPLPVLPPPSRRPPPARMVAWGAAIVALLVCAAGYFWLNKPATPERRFDTVAVLPFVNVGGDAGTEYLSDGMADNLIRNLSQVRTLKVRPFSSVIRFKENDVSAASQALKVEAVVVGRVRKQGDELSVSVELVDARDNRQLWGGQYHRKWGNLIVLQEDMAREIADALRLNLSGEEKQRLRKHYTESPEAQRLYLLGRYHWNKRSREGLRRAIDFFEQARRRDPRFALAYAGLADCYSLLPGYGYTEEPPRASFGKAKDMAEKALELDEGLAEAHTALAYVSYHVWEWQAADREFRKALQANPNYATAHHWYACYLSSMKRHDQALAEIKRAQDLDPSALIINGWVAMILCYGNQLEQAREQGKYLVQMDPDFAVGHFFLGIIYRKQGMFDAAVAEFKKAVDLDKDSTTYLTGLGEAYGASGQGDQARKILEELKGRARLRYVSPYGLAAVYAGLGETDKAISYLNEAYEKRDDGLANLRSDPSWDRLRAQPSFQALLQRMNYPE
jgi:serine/threonine-protein kinase